MEAHERDVREVSLGEATTAARPARSRAVLRVAGRVAAVLVALLLAAVLAGVFWAWRHLHASLPRVQGEVAVAGLSAPVRVERDGLGVPVIRGASREDVAFATGFVHAQDRFFQMDLLRRRAAGELSGLVGAATVPADSRIRVHRFRARAERAVEALPPAQRRVLDAYAAGVNSGLADLGAPPFEYTLLSADPEPWVDADSVLVVFSMYIELQEEFGGDEEALGLMQELLPAPVFAFLTPQGTEWEAPMLGPALRGAPVPTAAEVGRLEAPEQRVARLEGGDDPEWIAGSNAFAVAGSHTADGRALVADDMHLGLTVPNVWYRAAFAWPAAADGKETRMTGVTLPGTPLMAVGSNGRVAWGFSNAQVDTSDVVLLDVLPDDPERYRVPEGSEPFRHATETVRVKGGSDVSVDVRETRWGPVIGEDALGRLMALRWVAHDPGAVDLGLLGLETAGSVDEAIAIAERAGLPAQNFVVADRDGRIAWTLAGALPRRRPFDGRVPASWADGVRGWDGRLAPEDYPRIVDPEGGRIWTANQRMVGGELLDRVGDGGYALGARARQIRDRLAALDVADEASLLRVQLDDEAVFLGRWRGLFLEVLAAAPDDPARPYAEARRWVEAWGGHAATDSVGYRLVREFRVALAGKAFEAVTAPCIEADPEFVYHRVLDQYEGPLWTLVTERPPQLLDPRYESWEALLQAALDETLDGARDAGSSLAEWTWGAHNTLAMRHPLSRALPLVGGRLNMPADELPGDSRMPRVQAPSGGASERMVVAPGHEEDGIFHMPGGESAHPLSSHYRDGHAAWAAGEATPFLPGTPADVLVLTPRHTPPGA